MVVTNRNQKDLFIEEAQTLFREIDPGLPRPDKDSTPAAGKRDGEMALPFGGASSL